MQTILGSIMLWMSFHVQTLLDSVRGLSICFALAGFDAGFSVTVTWWRSQSADHIYALTVIFTLLVFIAATQGKSFR